MSSLQNWDEHLNGTVYGDLDNFNMHNLDCHVSFLLPENTHQWLFYLDVGFASHSLLRSVLKFNLFVWFFTNVQARWCVERDLLNEVQQRIGSLFTPWRMKIRTQCQDWTVWFFDEERFEPNSKNHHHISCILSCIFEFEVRIGSYSCLLTSVVLNFRHFFLRFPISFPAMSLFKAGSSDRTKLFTECTMINQILVSRLFAGRFPFSHEEQS